MGFDAVVFTVTTPLVEEGFLQRREAVGLCYFVVTPLDGVGFLERVWLFFPWDRVHFTPLLLEYILLEILLSAEAKSLFSGTHRIVVFLYT